MAHIAMRDIVVFKSSPCGASFTDIRTSGRAGPPAVLVEASSRCQGNRRKRKTGKSLQQSHCKRLVEPGLHLTWENLIQAKTCCRKAMGFLAHAGNGAIAPPAPLSEKETRAFQRELHTVNVGQSLIWQDQAANDLPIVLSAEAYSLLLFCSHFCEHSHFLCQDCHLFGVRQQVLVRSHLHSFVCKTALSICTRSTAALLL